MKIEPLLMVFCCRRLLQTAIVVFRVKSLQVLRRYIYVIGLCIWQGHGRLRENVVTQVYGQRI